MLEIVVPEQEFFDDETQTFIVVDQCKLQLEHSLISLSKWESQHNKPFLSSDKTTEEILDYVKDMTIGKPPPDQTYYALTQSNFADINAYIEAPMTATTFSDTSVAGRNREIITSELIYYWMISQNVPMECQKWHLNRLITLVRVCGIKNSPAKRKGHQSLAARRRELNASRRKALNTSG